MAAGVLALILLASTATTGLVYGGAKAVKPSVNHTVPSVAKKPVPNPRPQVKPKPRSR